MKFIDLAHCINDQMDIYPGDPEVQIEQLFTIEKNGWNMKRIHMNTHDGTHVNVPAHCIKNGKTLDDYSIEDFCGECTLFREQKDIHPGKGILFNIAITMEIADILIKNNPKFVGTSIDIDEEVEKYLLNHNIILFERLTGVEKLPNKFFFYGIPLKINQGDGSPVRAFALVQ